MSNLAEPFAELWRAASASFAEANDVLLSEGAKPGEDVVSFATQAAVVGSERIGLLVRKWLVSAEARALIRGERPHVMPILANAELRAAAQATATNAEGGKALLGVAGKRIAGTIRRWLESAAPDEARLLGCQIDAAVRLLKKRAR